MDPENIDGPFQTQTRRSGRAVYQYETKGDQGLAESPLTGVSFNTAPRSSDLAPVVSSHYRCCSLSEPYQQYCIVTILYQPTHSNNRLVESSQGVLTTVSRSLSPGLRLRCAANSRYAKCHAQRCAVAQVLQLGRENWFGAGCMHRHRLAICKSCKKSNRVGPSGLLPRHRFNSVSVKP